jgi:hypothetical protein
MCQYSMISGPYHHNMHILRLQMEEWPPIWTVAAYTVYRISSCGQPTKGGPPAWGLGEVLTTPHHKNYHCYDTDTCVSGLD